MSTLESSEVTKAEGSTAPLSLSPDSSTTTDLTKESLTSFAIRLERAKHQLSDRSPGALDANVQGFRELVKLCNENLSEPNRLIAALAPIMEAASLNVTGQERNEQGSWPLRTFILGGFGAEFKAEISKFLISISRNAAVKPELRIMAINPVGYEEFLSDGGWRVTSAMAIANEQPGAKNSAMTLLENSLRSIELRESDAVPRFIRTLNPSSRQELGSLLMDFSFGGGGRRYGWSNIVERLVPWGLVSSEDLLLYALKFFASSANHDRVDSGLLAAALKHPYSDQGRLSLANFSRDPSVSRHLKEVALAALQNQAQTNEHREALFHLCCEFLNNGGSDYRNDLGSVAVRILVAVARSDQDKSRSLPFLCAILTHAPRDSLWHTAFSQAIRYTVFEGITASEAEKEQIRTAFNKLWRSDACTFKELNLHQAPIPSNPSELLPELIKSAIDNAQRSKELSVLTRNFEFSNLHYYFEACFELLLSSSLPNARMVVLDALFRSKFYEVALDPLTKSKLTDREKTFISNKIAASLPKPTGIETPLDVGLDTKVWTSTLADYVFKLVKDSNSGQEMLGQVVRYHPSSEIKKLALKYLDPAQAIVVQGLGELTSSEISHSLEPGKERGLFASISKFFTAREIKRQISELSAGLPGQGQPG